MAGRAAVIDVAQGLGCSAMKPNLVRDLARNAEQFVTQVLDVAVRIRRHRHSCALSITDVNRALESRRIAPLIGYHRSYSVYEYVPIDQEACGLADPDVLLKSIVRRPRPPYPSDLTFDFHWLAVHGAQPRIRENQLYFFVRPCPLKARPRPRKMRSGVFHAQKVSDIGLMRLDQTNVAGSNRCACKMRLYQTRA
jgi:hypothetical protein